MLSHQENTCFSVCGLQMSTVLHHGITFHSGFVQFHFENTMSKTKMNWGLFQKLRINKPQKRKNREDVYCSACKPQFDEW